MKIADFEVQIDIYKYLQSKNLKGLKMVGFNAMACCPFHNEDSPSFGVHIETGLYQCFGCHSKGSFENLVKHLDHFDTVYDAQQFLADMYGTYSLKVDEDLTLDFNEKEKQIVYFISDDVLKNYKFRHPYLEKRGISEKWQRFFEIGYDTQKQAVTFPYRDHKGRLLTIKFRKTITKSFWYEPAMPSNVKKQTLYALDKAIKTNHKMIAITEAEIDCISVWQSEICSAVAIGGNQFTDEQALKMKNNLHYDSEILMFVDNDAGGDLAKEKIIEKLSTSFKISQVNWKLIPRKVKDANDLTIKEIKMLIENRESVGLELNF